MNGPKTLRQLYYAKAAQGQEKAADEILERAPPELRALLDKPIDELTHDDLRLIVEGKFEEIRSTLSEKEYALWLLQEWTKYRTEEEQSRLN
jgi:ATP-dependent Clp protease ATP-binding subunit ClpA